MNKRTIYIISGIGAAVILFGFLAGGSINNIFNEEDEVSSQNAVTSSPSGLLSSLPTSAVVISVKNVTVEKVDNKSATMQVSFDAYNPTNSTVFLDNIKYIVYVNGTLIASGSIGAGPAASFSNQGEVYSLIENETLRLKDTTVLERNDRVNGTSWDNLIGGKSEYMIKGIYTFRSKESASERNFEDFYPSQSVLSSTPSTSSAGSSLLSLVQTISLPNVIGRIDHMDVDIKGNRLFIAELGNNSVDIIDLREGKRIGSFTTGVNEPQGISFVPQVNRLFVANANGSVMVFDGNSLALAQTINLEGDADNIRYDSSDGLIYVGFGNGALAVINATSGKPLGTIGLPGHPESFQLEKFGHRIFVNVPTDNSIIVADKKNLKLISKWTITNASQNFPMALDEGNHRLFVGFRDPAKVIVFDTESGREIASLETTRDLDDIFYDGADKQIYVSAGEGAIDIFKQRDADHYDPVNRIQTVQGARTSLFVPELSRLYLAAPENQGQEAKIQIYEVER